MSKATPTHLTEFGFKAKQLGIDDADLTAYLQSVLDDVASEVAEKVGSGAYSAASGATLVRIRKAETYFAVAELWRRRIAKEDAAMRVSEDDPAVNIHAQYLKNAEAAEAEAWSWIAKVTGGGEYSAVAVNYVETGAFPATGT